MRNIRLHGFNPSRSVVKLCCAVLPIVENNLRSNVELINRYGTKRGYVRHLYCRLKLALGGYRQFTKVDWNRVVRIVFVCKGNICRSPYAEVRARRLGLNAISYGVHADHNAKVDLTAAKIAFNRGIYLREHQTRRIADAKINSRDLLVVMEPGHATALRRISKQAGAQLTLLGLWCTIRRPYLQDPYGLSDDYFMTCFAAIDSAVHEIGRRMSHNVPGGDGLMKS